MTTPQFRATVRAGCKLPRFADKWHETANAYTVTLRNGKRVLTTPFFTGTGWKRDPTAADVLESLISDAAGADNARTFEEWCSEYGYDTDSRKAEATFKACKRTAEKLRAFLGDDYDAALAGGEEWVKARCAE